MPKRYTVIPGDTFEIVSRKAYGTEVEAGRIFRANPGATDPLAPGSTIVIPDLPDAPRDKFTASSGESDTEVTIAIEGKTFRYWDALRIQQSLDSFTTVAFSTPFTPEDASIRTTFVPFSYKECTVSVGGERLFTGTIIGIDPRESPNGRTLEITAYSLPGVLADCNAPVSTYPLEYKGQRLENIATAICEPFGLGVIVEGSQAAFDEVKCDALTRPLDFLSELAKQRNQVITNDPRGRVVFYSPDGGGRSIGVLRQGQSPLMSVTPTFSPQDYYSDITGIEPVKVGEGGGSKYTVKNSRLTGTARPHTFDVPDTAEADVKTATEAKLGRMFGAAVSYSVEVSTWRDPEGKVWSPDTTVTLEAPGAMIYSEYDLLVRSVELSKTADTETARLTLVLPGSFSGKIPEALPWE